MPGNPFKCYSRYYDNTIIVPFMLEDDICVIVVYTDL